MTISDHPDRPDRPGDQPPAAGDQGRQRDSAGSRAGASCVSVVAAAKSADWQQVVLNGGPPCFHVERDGSFCLRSTPWEGHHATKGEWPFHQFVSLADLLSALTLAQERLQEELEQWRTWGIIEIAVRNPNVASYMDHWEGRATTAEQRLSTLSASLTALRDEAQNLATASALAGNVILADVIKRWADTLSALLVREEP